MPSRMIDHKPSWMADAVYYAELRKRHARDYWKSHERTRWNRFVAWVKGY